MLLEIEYCVKRRKDRPMSETELAILGQEGWSLSAILTETRKVKVPSYPSIHSKIRREVTFLFFFQRPKKPIVGT